MDLARLIDKQSRQNTTWLFRGEPATTYELRPGAGREGNDERSARTLKYDLEQERIALQRFRHDAQPFVGFRALHGSARHVGWHYKWGLSQGPLS